MNLKNNKMKTKQQPKSIMTFNSFLKWMEKISNIYTSDLLSDNDRFVNLMEKFKYLDN